jgi:hypothetical protein
LFQHLHENLAAMAVPGSGRTLLHLPDPPYHSDGLATSTPDLPVADFQADTAIQPATNVTYWPPLIIDSSVAIDSGFGAK